MYFFVTINFINIDYYIDQYIYFIRHFILTELNVIFVYYNNWMNENMILRPTAFIILYYSRAFV